MCDVLWHSVMGGGRMLYGGGGEKMNDWDMMNKISPRSGGTSWGEDPIPLALGLT